MVLSKGWRCTVDVFLPLAEPAVQHIALNESNINMSQHHWKIANTTECISGNYWDLMQILFTIHSASLNYLLSVVHYSFQIIGLQFGCRLVPVAIDSETNKRWSGAGSSLLLHLVPSTSVLVSGTPNRGLTRLKMIYQVSNWQSSKPPTTVCQAPGRSPIWKKKT